MRTEIQQLKEPRCTASLWCFVILTSSRLSFKNENAYYGVLWCTEGTPIVCADFLQIYQSADRISMRL